MAEAEKTPNVVVCCSKPGLYEELEDIQKRYFVSSLLLLFNYGRIFLLPSSLIVSCLYKYFSFRSNVLDSLYFYTS